jgi:hypothetical protein
MSPRTLTDNIGREEDQVIEQVLAVLGQGDIRVIGWLVGELEAAVSQRLEECRVGLADTVVVQEHKHTLALSVSGDAIRAGRLAKCDAHEREQHRHN